MTNIQEWRDFLGKFGIKFEEIKRDGKTSLMLDADSCPVVTGYFGFSVEVEFDQSGAFVNLWIGE